MSSLRADFDELMRRVDRGREFADASYEPIFYLVFHPRDILEVKRLMPGWTARLRNDGWQVEIFSIAEHIGEILARRFAGIRLWPTQEMRAGKIFEEGTDVIAQFPIADSGVAQNISRQNVEIKLGGNPQLAVSAQNRLHQPR